jgi:transglutaminase-like putative cysteine protease
MSCALPCVRLVLCCVIESNTMTPYATYNRKRFMTASVSARSTDALRRFPGSFYFQDGLVLTSILVTLLYLILASTLDAAGHVESMTLLIPVTLGAVLLGGLMAYSRFDGFFSLSHSMITGLAWILWLMAGTVTKREVQSFLDFGLPTLQARVYYVLWTLLNWVDAAINRSASNDNYVFVFEIAFLLWWLAYLGVWTIFRHGYIWRAITPASIVLLINTYYAPQPVVGFLVAFCVVLLILLVHTNLAEQQLRWREQRISFDKEVTLDFLRHGVIYSIVVLALAWLAPDLGRNPQVRELLAPVSQRVEAANARLSRMYQGLTPRSAASGDVFGRSLSLRGERTVDDTPVFTVNTTAKRYWRAVVFDTFTGRQWLNTLEGEVRFDADIPLAPVWPVRELVTQTVTLLAPTGDVLFGAADIRQLSVPADVVAQMAPIAAVPPPGISSNNVEPGIEVVYARASQPLEVGDSYTVISQVPGITRQLLENSDTDYPPAILEKYLQLPDSFSSRVTQTAIRVTVDAATPYAKAKALESWLRTFKYNDAIAAPPPDVDPLEYFLFDIKEGYCDYYASALAMMLRSLGIPARTVSGYASGTFDEASGAYFVTARDAHTWVEVFFPNLGWVEFEPTANRSVLEPPESAVATDPMVLPTATPGTPLLPQQPLSSDFQQPLGDPRLDSADALSSFTANQPEWLWPTLALLMLGLGLLGLRYRQRAGLAIFTPELPSQLYARLQSWGERLGLSLRASDTPYEQARSLSRTLPGGQPQIKQLTDAYVRYCFRSPLARNADDPGLPTNEVLVNTWLQLHSRLRRAWLRRIFASLRRRRTRFFSSF